MASHQLSEFERYYERRRRTERNRRMLNNLPLAHRLAADRADNAVQEEFLLGQAMVGLVAAVDEFEPAEETIRFRAFAKPRIASALDRAPGAAEVRAAQAEVAEAISNQDRVIALASFLDVGVDALVGGLMDASAREHLATRHRPLRGVA